MMKEVKKDENEKAIREGRKLPEIKLIFDVGANVDKRRYNIPKANEVAAVFVLKDGEEVPEYQAIAIHNKETKKMKFLTKYDKRTESMIYPIFFPTGKGGPYANMKDKNDNKLTFNEYYRNLIRF